MLREHSTDDLAKILWDYNSLDQPVKKSDCILVLGSHDIRVAQRGAELYLQGYASLIIFSGGVGRLTEGLWDKFEAEIFAEEAIRLGVPKSSILIENKSSNTGENIEFTKILLAGRHVVLKNIVLVHKPYMQRRSYATFKKIWPEVEILVTAPQISLKDYPNELISKDEMINILVGDTQRIKIYAEKGFQIPQEMPQGVWDAYVELVRRGFTDQVVK